jgi:hypothetical protein
MFNTHYILSTKNKTKKGYVLALVVVVLAILAMLGAGEMMSSYQARIQAINSKSQMEAMLAAEAGFEKAIFWMSKQPDILGALQTNSGSGNIEFGSSHCRYQIAFRNFMGSRPLFRISSIGTCGRPVFGRAINVDVVQEVTGWAMGRCEIPTGTSSTVAVNFVDGEIIDMPVHINDLRDNPDKIDIHINGSPQFLQKVEMGEPRKTSTGSDKYKTVMSYFGGGISFDQPFIRITDSTAVTSKINRFRDSTKTAYKFTPVAYANLGAGITRIPAVQLEFFVQDNVGKVRITNNCTVRGFQQTSDSHTYNFMITPGSNPQTYQRYNIYAYHYRPPEANSVKPITDTYVRQTFGGYESEPGGQIFVNGNVVIGSDTYTNMVLKGKLTVVATGNIWIADNITVDGDHDANGLPLPNNPNVLGLIAQGVIKVVDPGLASYASGGTNGYPGPALANVTDANGAKHYYAPVCNGTLNSNVRSLPNPTVIEAALTIGGGGWGTENVEKNSSGTYYGGRKESNPGTQDKLIVRGSIAEAIRGVVGSSSSGREDGYYKTYYMDKRLTQGILPADIWFSGKYIPAPAGWQDYSSRATD